MRTTLEVPISSTPDRPYVNVRDHGAAGDGSTDDTAAFAAARTAAAAAKLPLYIPGSDDPYIVDQATFYGCDVICDSAAMLKTKSTSTVAVLVFGPMRWQGGIIDGNTPIVGTTGYGMGLFGNGAVIEGVTFQNIDGPGIQTGGGYGHRILHCVINIADQSGILVAPNAGSGDPDVTDMLIDGCIITITNALSIDYWCGIKVYPITSSVSGLRIVNNRILMPNAPGSSGAMCIELNSSGGPVSQCVVAHNTLMRGGMGISTSAYNSVFEGNTIIGPGNWGIELGGFYNTCVGNNIEGVEFGTTTQQTLEGMILSGGGQVVSGNMIHSTINKGIAVAATYSVLSGNFVEMATGYCLYLYDGTASMITGNCLVADGSAAYYGDDGSPGTSIKYYGNSGITDSS
jgi:hypothetical protein